MKRSCTAILLAAGLFASGALANEAAMLKMKTLTRAPAESASGGASARLPRPQDQVVFREMDQDNDGYLSEAELWRADPRPGTGWMAMDRDNDRRIAPSEFAAIR